MQSSILNSSTQFSSTTIRRRRDEWIAADSFTYLEQTCLEVYDRIEGLDLKICVLTGALSKRPVSKRPAAEKSLENHR